MLMDEPFSAVDPVVRAELHEFFLNLQREISKTIILITHDIDEAIKLGDQVAILRVGGHLAQVGTPQQLLDEPADAFVEGFVGRDRGYRSLSFQPASTLDLDSVPVGLAVGVHAGSGRYAGVVTTETVLAAMKRAKASHPQESITLTATAADPEDDRRAGDLQSDDRRAGDETVVRRGGAHSLAAAGAGDEPEDAHSASAELGDESGQDVDPEALTPDERNPGEAPGADLLGHESALSTQETRAATTDSDDVDVRR
jgi:hypothetical protein